MSRIVSDIVSCENQIHQFFLNQKIGSLLKRSNIDKEKGISPVFVFRVLVTLVFTGKNLYRTLEAGGSCGMTKDTVYRFLNPVHTNWRRFLLLLSSRVIGRELEPLTGADDMKVMIADDTLYRHNRSKHVELLSRVFDHTDKRYYRGFRMLTLGWSDGISFLPVSCALLASSQEKNRLVPLRTNLDRRTNGARRRREGIRKATDVFVEMLAEAIASGIQAKHLLFDSWFAFPATMRRLLAKGVHTICMLKVTEKIFYRYQGGRSPSGGHLQEDPQASRPRKDSRFGYGRERKKRPRRPGPGKDRIRPGQAHQKVVGPVVHRHLPGRRADHHDL